jgi:hypothetical protein
MGWHTTHFARLYNYTNTRWNIVDLEDPGWPMKIVPPSATTGFSFKEFPWCADRGEVMSRAFRFNRGGDPVSGGGLTAFYLYQDYASSLVFTLPAVGEPRRALNEVAETVNVYLNAADAAGNWDGQVEVVRS